MLFIRTCNKQYVVYLQLYSMMMICQCDLGFLFEILNTDLIYMYIDIDFVNPLEPVHEPHGLRAKSRP